MNDNSLKIFNWNVRGLNSVVRREAVKLMIQQANPTIICLQETKLNSVDGRLAMELLGPRFNNHLAFIPADEIRGGVLIA
jgi:exonuclease III